MTLRIKKIGVVMALCVLMALPALIVSGQGTIAGSCSCGCKGKESNGCCKGYSASRITKQCHILPYGSGSDEIVECYWYQCTDPKDKKYCKGNSNCSSQCISDHMRPSGS